MHANQAYSNNKQESLFKNGKFHEPRGVEFCDRTMTYKLYIEIVSSLKTPLLLRIPQQTKRKKKTNSPVKMELNEIHPVIKTMLYTYCKHDMY